MYCGTGQDTHHASTRVHRTTVAHAELRATPPLVCVAGVRKEFDVNGLSVLVFWYRNALYAIESRSPAEGAYAEGFIKAKFTQVRAHGQGWCGRHGWVSLVAWCGTRNRHHATRAL
jgi:hypothetical protein